MHKISCLVNKVTKANKSLFDLANIRAREETPNKAIKG